jgi:hypothetical protein
MFLLFEFVENKNVAINFCTLTFIKRIILIFSYYGTLDSKYNF